MTGWLWGWEGKRESHSKFSLMSLFISASRMSAWAFFNSGAFVMEGTWGWRLDHETDMVEMRHSVACYRGLSKV
ncbi:hypothetical protein T484DRAFT_1907544, partial [Baffinella frigidus]